jgi:hypothetical protein
MKLQYSNKTAYVRLLYDNSHVHFFAGGKHLDEGLAFEFVVMLPRELLEFLYIGQLGSVSRGTAENLLCYNSKPSCTRRTPEL